MDETLEKLSEAARQHIIRQYMMMAAIGLGIYFLIKKK